MDVCKRGHVDAGRTKRRNCKACERERKLAKAQASPEAHAQKSREWRKSHPGRGASPSGIVWRQRNPGLINAHHSQRRSRQAQRTPAWANLSKIQIVFRVARQMQRELRVRMSVDHVIPLKGETVSGLHVHENLRIIPFVENARKSNSYQCT